MGRCSKSRWVIEQVCDQIEKRRTLGLHQRAAELLIELDGAQCDPGRLARLWSAAGRRGEAADCAERAALLAEQHGDPAAAAERWAMVIDHRPARDKRRGELQRRQAEALVSAGRHEAAAEVLAEMLRVAPSRAERADVLGRQAHALVQAGRFAQAREAAEQALALATGPELRRERGADLSLSSAAPATGRGATGLRPSPRCSGGPRSRSSSAPV